MEWVTILLAIVFAVGGAFIFHKLNSHKKRHPRLFKPVDPSTLPKYNKPNLVLFSSDPSVERPPIIATRHHAAKKPTTVIAVFKKAAQEGKKKNGNAFQWEEEGREGNVWKHMGYDEYYENSERVAKSLIKVGLGRFGGVSIIGFNSPEWMMTHMGTIMAGGLAAGIYTTNKPESCKYIVNHSQSVVVVCEDLFQLNKFLTIADQLPTVKLFVVYKEKNLDSVKSKISTPIVTWKEFLALGNDVDQKALEERISSQRPGHPCSLIYTSGTTGPPKAVMITHDNATWTASAMRTVVTDWGNQPERLVSYLPLSHIAAQLEDVYFPVWTTANYHPTTVYFARPDALKGSLKDTLQHVRPTLFFGVPRVWEKFMEGIQKVSQKSGTMGKIISSWAKEAGKAHWTACQYFGYDHPAPLSYYFWKILVFDRIKKALGLDCCRICLTGAAPISMDVLTYFASIDIHVHNLYGMSETSGPFTTTRPDYFRAGSAGAPLDGLELKIDHVDGRDKEGEGEICFRGRNVMLGYLRDAAKTEEVFDSEGFLHSGDVGKVDKTTGLLYITGRIKELIITAGGENIAPVPIEEILLKEMPALSNVMLVGDRRKFNSVLVTLKTEIDPTSGMPLDRLIGAALEVSDAKTVGEAQRDEKWRKYIEAGIKRYNGIAVSSAQCVQKYAILERDFSIAGGELTDTLKLKRSVVCDRFRATIESLYDEESKE